MITVRAMQPEDFDGWGRLWLGYLRFYRSESEVPDQTTADTFDRLATGRDGFAGRVAVDEHGGLVGLAHMVFHPSTWATAPSCYLEDLFVAPAARGTGAAAALIDAV
ncbi:MAG TPA: GNAT family N-acetyltransferase, partial [Acidimicrobiia bacterium]|nr:GNAT family N-acetyltransferase [Acidimicrobiia bacterium]